MATWPGFHSDFDISRYPRVIQTAIRRIAGHFYVTRAFHPLSIGNSQYWSILVRPTDEFSLYINTDREIVVIFSEYESFEIRTLEAYDEVYGLLDSARIDRSIRFLISNDDRIEKIIRHYLDQNPEYPIIIPETFEKIRNSTESALLGAVRRNYLLRDLFGYQNPLREETFFFGRQNIVNFVLDMAKSGQNSSIFGLRKSGKTSVIYAIRRKSRAFSCNVVLIDCQTPAVHARKYSSLLSYIISEIRQTVGQKRLMPDLGSSPVEVSENFNKEMNIIISNAKGNILILFDEIENISPATASSVHWRVGAETVYFWQIIRSFIQSESKGRVSLCIVGTNPSLIEARKINEIANPVYLYAQKIFIPNLTFDETREMVERLGYFMGLEFSAEIIADIQKEFGGHPFFTRQVCSKIHQLASIERPIKVSQSVLNRAKSEFSGQLETYLRDIVENLRDNYPEEFEILKSVLNKDSREVSEFGREAPELIDHLIGYGLIDRVQDDFDIKFDAIKRALSHIVVDSALSEKWKELVVRRNNMERSIRSALFYWSKAINLDVWEDILKVQLTNKRFSDLTTIEPAVLLSNTQSPLYLTDILMIIRDVRVMPYLHDRRRLIVENLNLVNMMRKDAHANEISDNNMNLVRMAFGYLEDEFMSP